MPPDLIAALAPPVAAPGSPAAPGAGAILTGSPAAGLFASLLAATAPPAPALPAFAAAPAPLPSPSPPVLPEPLMHTTTVLTKISFSPPADPTEPVPPALKKPPLCETEQMAAILVPVPPLLLPPTPPESTKPDTAADSTQDGKTKDSKTKDARKEPVDTAPALVPAGELLLPPPPVIAGLPALLPALLPGPLPAAVPAATAAFETTQAPREPAVSAFAPAAPAAVAVLGTPSVDVPIAASPAVPAPAIPVPAAVPVTDPAPSTGVGGSPAPALLPVPALFSTGQKASAPDKNSASKTPQKDLKTAGVRADTITRTQTELPRITHLTRKEPPTDGASTDETRREERRTDAGQGPATLLQTAPALQAGTAATAAVPETNAVTAAPALTHTEKLAIVQQLADGAGGMRLSVKPGESEQMTVQLHPKDWGSLHVTVQIAPSPDAQAALSTARGDAPTGNALKTVTAHIVAETPQVKAALESHTGDLHQKLREAGLHLSSVTVTVRAPEAAHSSSGMTPHGGQTDSQGRFQEGMQGSPNGGTQSQGGVQGGDFGQRLTDTGRQEGSPGSSAEPALSGGGASHSEGGRQGSQTPREPLRWIGTEPEREAAPRWAATRSSGAVRLDLRA